MLDSSSKVDECLIQESWKKNAVDIRVAAVGDSNNSRLSAGLRFVSLAEKIVSEKVSQKN